jgi:molybdopterin/thiamine biosynthesis adenylyltransferase
MNTEQLKRYDRQMSLPELGLEGQLKLLNSKVLVIGAGGLGCPILFYLAGAGIGRIGIVDHDTVDETNLHRQILYHTADIGRLKAEVAAEKLKSLNPQVHLVAYPYQLREENAAEVFSGYDLIIDGSDNFPTRYLVNDTCLALNIPLVFGSIFQFEGQVSVFNYQGGPDYRVLYPDPPAPENTNNCGESGVVGTLPGIVGSIMANEALKALVGFGQVLSAELLVFNALNNETTLFKFGKPGRKTGLEKGSTTEMDIDLLEIWKTMKIPFQLVDVREAYEFDERNIGGINIPLYELTEQIGRLAFESRIVFCCTSGTRSKIALNLLKSQYDKEVFTLILPQA